MLKEFSEQPSALICDLSGVDHLDRICAALFARPPYLREELVLAPTLSAPAAARAFVLDTCVDWQLAQPEEPWLDRAVLLANELVANAVIHAGTNLRLRVELRGDLLHIAVRGRAQSLRKGMDLRAGVSGRAGRAGRRQAPHRPAGASSRAHHRATRGRTAVTSTR
jgi:hypothetical protein